jgi:hypothetical protein
VATGVIAAVGVLAVMGGIGSAVSGNGSGKTNTAVQSSSSSEPIQTPTIVGGDDSTTEQPTDEDTSSDEELNGLALGTRVDITSSDDGEGWVKVSKVAIGYVEYDPASHGRYVKIYVTYHCTTGTLDYNELDWSVTNKSHREYESTFAGRRQFGLGNLHRGRTTSGWVDFDVSKSPVTTISYVPNYSGDPLASWKVHI